MPIFQCIQNVFWATRVKASAPTEKRGKSWAACIEENIAHLNKQIISLDAGSRVCVCVCAAHVL